MNLGMYVVDKEINTQRSYPHCNFWKDALDIVPTYAALDQKPEEDLNLTYFSFFKLFMLQSLSSQYIITLCTQSIMFFCVLATNVDKLLLPINKNQTC